MTNENFAEKFLGDQQKSYGQVLSFDLKMREDEPSVASGSSGEDYSRPRPRLSRQDVVLQSEDHTVGITINSQVRLLNSIGVLV